MRVRQRGQGQAKGGISVLGVALGRGAERDKGGIQLHARTEQQHIPLEGRQVEQSAQGLQGGRRGYGLLFPVESDGRGRRAAGRPILSIGRAPFQRLPHLRQGSR